MDGEHVGPFNLGNPGEFTMLELAEVCLFLFNFSFANIYRPGPLVDSHIACKHFVVLLIFPYCGT